MTTSPPTMALVLIAAVMLANASIVRGAELPELRSSVSSYSKEHHMVRMSDGVMVSVLVHKPNGPGPFPTLFAASPYRLDNDDAPSLPIFPFRETGPIKWYVEQGYAFVRLDARGTGRSHGEYKYQDHREQRDLAEVIDWIGAQPWSNGKVGGIGQSYYARSQWFAAAQAPKNLVCIAPYDGNIDTYRASAYTGGIPGTYPNYWFNYVRGLNIAPFQGEPRSIPWDYPYAVTQHPLYDDFWKERAVAERLRNVKIPVFSIGVWGKVDLHLNGNIVGYQSVSGPKKLLVLGGANVDAAVVEYSSVGFHEKYMLPFYDWCLKGKTTSYQSEPEVRYAVTGSSDMRTASSWPPSDAVYQRFYLSPTASNSVSSLNDGSLSAEAPGAGGGATSLQYPQPKWNQAGVVTRGADGRPDTARNVLTFTSAPFSEATTIAGPILLRVTLTSSRPDADIVAKLYEQEPQSEEERKKGQQPRDRLLTKGWLRASHRAADASLSKDHAPWYRHTKQEFLTPGRPYTLDVAIMPTAARVRANSRLRLEIANSDSILTETIFAHAYYPEQVGSYEIHHDAIGLSYLEVPFISVK